MPLQLSPVGKMPLQKSKLETWHYNFLYLYKCHFLQCHTIYCPYTPLHKCMRIWPNPPSVPHPDSEAAPGTWEHSVTEPFFAATMIIPCPSAHFVPPVPLPLWPWGKPHRRADLAQGVDGACQSQVAGVKRGSEEIGDTTKRNWAWVLAARRATARCRAGVHLGAGGIGEDDLESARALDLVPRAANQFQVA
jgi:hypothetical protein